MHLTSGLSNAEEKLLRITPSEELVFKGAISSLKSKLEIRNISNSTVTFKIKSTNPPQFEVTPSQGTLARNEKIHIEIKIKGNNPASATLERILIESIELPKNYDFQKIKSALEEKVHLPKESKQLYVWINSFDIEFNESLLRNPPLERYRSIESNSDDGFLNEIKIDPELVNLQYKNYCEALITRIEEQDKSIREMQHERDTLLQEMAELKSIIQKSNERAKRFRKGNYETWHILLAALVGLIIGAYLLKID